VKLRAEEKEQEKETWDCELELGWELARARETAWANSQVAW